MSEADHDFIVADAVTLTPASMVAIRPNWNTDGRSLVFESREAGGSRLHRIGLDDRIAVSLDLCNAGATRVQGRPAFFNADDFAYVSDRSGALAIWRCELRSGRVTQLTFPRDGEVDFGPATTHGTDGRFLFFRKPKGAEGPRVHLGRLGAHAVESLTRETSNQPWPLHATNDMVFHSAADHAHRVYRQRLLPGERPDAIGDHDEGTDYVTPYPSPDDRHLAFTSVVEGTTQIFTMRLDGTHRQQITVGPEPAMFPCWSPDGTRIAFVRGDPTADAPAGRLACVSIAQR